LGGGVRFAPRVFLTQEIITPRDMPERVTVGPGNYFHDGFAEGNDVVVP
jgi:hypothetical protein